MTDNLVAIKFARPKHFCYKLKNNVCQEKIFFSQIKIFFSQIKTNFETRNIKSVME